MHQSSLSRSPYAWSPLAPNNTRRCISQASTTPNWSQPAQSNTRRYLVQEPTTNPPRYEDVKQGTTGHAEAVQVRFDPRRLSYEQLLAFVFRLHDPTTVDRQGNDRGTQYRSTIFFHSDDQRRTAERVKQQVDQFKKWPRPVVTTIVAASSFYPAEGYHQDYVEKNPGGYTCHFLRE
ncbi:MAG: peptide-methionine (S)-S-oxide reductase MsrA [Proteobacteria bacterium]|nr:peptide-methionine (S)-S-oxide reductase MsrA [Pseudomonadota bacterium]